MSRKHREIEQDPGVHFEKKSKKSWHTHITYISCTRQVANGIFSNNSSTRPLSVHGMHVTSQSSAIYVSQKQLAQRDFFSEVLYKLTCSWPPIFIYSQNLAYERNQQSTTTKYKDTSMYCIIGCNCSMTSHCSSSKFVSLQTTTNYKFKLKLLCQN